MRYGEQQPVAISIAIRESDAITVGKLNAACCACGNRQFIAEFYAKSDSFVKSIAKPKRISKLNAGSSRVADRKSQPIARAKFVEFADTKPKSISHACAIAYG